MINGTKVICLVGSTKFTEQMLIKQWELTTQGVVALGWCTLPNSYTEGKTEDHIAEKEGVRDTVNEVHLRKIDISDEVLVVNVNGYMGEDTLREIRYAEGHNKPVRFLEKDWRRGIL